jgi:hypothetical protein
MNTLDEQIQIMKQELNIMLERRKKLPKLIKNKKIDIHEYMLLLNESDNKLQRYANQLTLNKLILQKQQLEDEQAQLEQQSTHQRDQYFNLVHQRDIEREQQRQNDICNTVSWDLPGCNISGGKKRKTKRSKKNKRKSIRKCR